MMKKFATGLMIWCAALVSHGALVGHYKFDEGGGSVLTNSASPGTYDGVFTGTGTPVWTSGFDGQALVFDGNMAVSVGNVLATVTNEITVAFWCKDSTTNWQQNAFTAAAASGTTRWLNCHFPWGSSATNSATATLYYDAYSPTYVRDRIQVTVPVDKYYALWGGEWNHWTFTKNAIDGTMKVYINGVIWQNATGKTQPMIGLTRFWIGGGIDGTANLYTGAIDDFRIYDNELEASEIALLVDPSVMSTSFERSPWAGQAPVVATFDASASYAGRGIAEYLWDFGESTNSTIVSGGVTMTNTYEAVGTYTAKLYIVDNTGVTNGPVSKTVVAAEGPTWSANLPAMTYTAENWVSTNYPSVSSTDLAQTAYLTNNLYSQSAILSTDWTNLLDGVVGTADVTVSNTVATPAGTARMYANDWFEVVFDTTSAPFGYDLTQIRTIMGWGILAGGRANQGYDVIVTYTDGSTETIASYKYWNVNDPTTYWTGVTLAADGGGKFVSNVKAVQIKITQAAVPGGWLLVREFDFFGVPSTAGKPVLSSTLVPAGLEIKWDSTAGALYTVQRKTDLIFGSWVDTAYKNVPATPPMNVVTAAVDSASTQFFHVIIEN